MRGLGEPLNQVAQLFIQLFQPSFATEVAEQSSGLEWLILDADEIYNHPPGGQIGPAVPKPQEAFDHVLSLLLEAFGLPPSADHQWLLETGDVVEHIIRHRCAAGNHLTSEISPERFWF